MIDTRLIGPKDDQYAVLSRGTVWLATTKAPYAEAVSAAIAAAIAGGGATDAAPSATAAPVAWCVGYDDPRMGRIHSDPTMHKPQAEALAERNGLALVSLYAGSLPVEEKAIGHARYEYVRTLNPRRFAALYNESLMGVHQFDDLVDRYRDAGEKP